MDLWKRRREIMNDLEKRGGKLYGMDNTHLRLTEIARLGMYYGNVYEFETEDGYRYVRVAGILASRPMTEVELNWLLDTAGRMYLEPVEEDLPF